MNRLILHNHLIFRWCSYFYEQQTVCKWVISDSCYIHTHSSSFSRFPFRDLLTEVQCALYLTLLEFTSNVEDESDLEGLIEQQFEALQKAFKIPHKASEARLMVSKKHLTLFRAGKIGPFILDDVPDANTMSWLVSHFFFFGVTLRLYMQVFYFSSSFPSYFVVLMSQIYSSCITKLIDACMCWWVLITFLMKNLHSNANDAPFWMH